MRLSEINKPAEKYILDESIKAYYYAMVNKANYLKRRMDAGRVRTVVEDELNSFYNEYSETLPIIRTVLAYDQYLRDRDSNLPTIVGISKLLNGDEAGTKKELSDFYKTIILKNPSVHSTYRTFSNQARTKFRRTYKGYSGGGFVMLILELDEDVRRQLADLYGRTPLKKELEVLEAFKDMGITEIATLLSDANIHYDPERSLNESKKSDEVDNYYMVVELQLFDNVKSDTMPHRNFKNVIVTRAKSASEARRKLKQSMNRSLRELNDKLKARNMSCTCKYKNWDTNALLQRGYDTMVRKNIRSLTGSDAVSTGAYILKGMTGHGTVGDLPEIAPNRYALHSSKASVSRYLNRECGNE